MTSFLVLFSVDADAVVRTMLALEEARIDFTNGKMRKKSDIMKNISNGTTTITATTATVDSKQIDGSSNNNKSHPLGAGMAAIFGNYSRERSKSKSPPANDTSPPPPATSKGSVVTGKVNDPPPLPFISANPPPPPPPQPLVAQPQPTPVGKPPTISSNPVSVHAASVTQSVKSVTQVVTSAIPHPVVSTQSSYNMQLSMSPSKRSWTSAPTVAKPSPIGPVLPTTPFAPKSTTATAKSTATATTAARTVVNAAPTPTHVFKGATYYNEEGKAVEQASSKPAFTANDFPISKDGACPYCRSTDVVYIILQEEGAEADPLPDMLQKLNKMGKAVKRKKGAVFLFNLPIVRFLMH